MIVMNPSTMIPPINIAEYDPVLVSVVIITYNQEAYLSQAVQSVLDQVTDFAVEIIIGDDGSHDRTPDICREWQQKHPEKIRLILQPSNIGIMGNYLAVLKQCRGKYIAQLGGDDYWTDSYKLQKQYNILENNHEIGLVYTDVDFLYEESQRFERAVFQNHIIHKPNNLNDLLIYQGFLAPLTWMYRRELSPLQFNYSSDYVDESFAFLLDVFQTSQVAGIDEVTAVYRRLPSSASNHTQNQKKLKFHRGLLKIKTDFLLKYPFSDDFRNDILLRAYQYLSKLALQVGDVAYAEALQPQAKWPPIIFMMMKMKYKIKRFWQR